MVATDDGAKTRGASKTPWWQLAPMPESDRGHRWLLKATITTIVFPTLLLTLMQPWKLVLLALGWILPRDPLWAQWVGWCAVVLGLIVPAWGAFWVCRLIWPKSVIDPTA
jgi:hypothetical protein